MARTLNNEVDVLNIASLDNDIKDSFTRAMITEDVNTTSAAAKAYDKGDYFVHTDRYLYKALEDIAAGTAITPDVNAEVVTVSEELVRLFAQSPESIFEILSNVENSSVASKNYVKGTQFIWTDKKLYKVTADDIAIGSTFVVGTNIELADNLTSQISSVNEALTNLTEITTYQRALQMPSSGSFLDFIDDNCVGTGLYTISIGDTTNITDLPAGFGGYSASYILSRLGAKQVFLTTYKNYAIWMNITLNGTNWVGWKKLSTDIALPTQRVAITGVSEYYTIEQNGVYVESYYYNRFGLCFVEVNVRCVTPQTGFTEIAGLPLPNAFTTIHPVLVAETGKVMPVVFQSGHLFVKGGTAGELYSGTFCYPIQ